MRTVSEINDEINQIGYASDLKVWGTKDFWATPKEFKAKGKGDCEEFAFAKYFALLEEGYKVDKLRICYVNSLSLRSAHMVLWYDEYILDNAAQYIALSHDRTDLIPVYAFNHNSLWVVNRDWSFDKVGTPKHLSKWQNLLKRMQDEL